MSVVEYSVQTLDTNHAIIFVRTSDKELHAFELGQPEHVPTPEEEAARRGVHGHSQHSAIKQKHEKGRRNSDEEGAACAKGRRASKDAGHSPHEKGRRNSSDKHQYPIKFWSPVTLRHPQPKVPSNFTPVVGKHITAEQLNHTLKHEFHHAYMPANYDDAKHFTNHVVNDVLLRAQ
jgi:hypothetical protein